VNLGVGAKTSISKVKPRSVTSVNYLNKLQEMKANRGACLSVFLISEPVLRYFVSDFFFTKTLEQILSS
jgi:hypothetical protein